ncbi:hypothetical protein [Cellulomonas hominis]|uniref:hypothetical protein n=1 Tax=Cellulomonas hominis TaxID=156981 RepID=UPI001B9D8129|nr:hypothetical protein [Cellulomonas hominis]VTR77466.1 hypothetical protein CHMI_02235 [Cellulomonas hominis]
MTDAPHGAAPRSHARAVTALLLLGAALVVLAVTDLGERFAAALWIAAVVALLAALALEVRDLRLRRRPAGRRPR